MEFCAVPRVWGTLCNNVGYDMVVILLNVIFLFSRNPTSLDVFELGMVTNNDSTEADDLVMILVYAVNFSLIFMYLLFLYQNMSPHLHLSNINMHSVL